MSWHDALREKARLLRILWKALTAADGSDMALSDDDFPPEDRWWSPEVRETRPEEYDTICQHCTNALGRATVKICPNCGVVLHATCYEDTVGGHAYATEGCDTCRHRTYWR